MSAASFAGISMEAGFDEPVEILWIDSLSLLLLLRRLWDGTTGVSAARFAASVNRLARGAISAQEAELLVAMSVYVRSQSTIK